VINLYGFVLECLFLVLLVWGGWVVLVLVVGGDGEIILVVEDNGIGMSAKDKARGTTGSRGLGLAGMRERATLIGGTLEIESSPSKGTTILVRVPDR
jgi:signal transduction histidine kinase